jgi:hypothetical protein
MEGPVVQSPVVQSLSVQEPGASLIIPEITPDPQTRKQKIHCKQELIISSLQRFYSQREDIDEIVELLKGTSEVSLRLIDWFVTNYSKAHNTSYMLNGQEFAVYMNYKNQLKAYSKKLFDPFCRRERILFQVPKHEAFLTTVGKLNFFRWALEKGILDHIKLHQQDIEKEMNAAMKEQTKAKTPAQAPVNNSTQKVAPAQAPVAQTQTRKRSGRQAAVSKLVQKHDCKIVMEFS